MQNRFLAPRPFARVALDRLSRRRFLHGALGSAAAMSVLSGEWEDVTASAASHLVQEEAEPVALGAYLPDVLYDPAVLDGFTTAIRRDPDFLVSYVSWSDGDFDENDQRDLLKLQKWGMTPVIAWDPFNPDGPTIDQPKYKLSNIVRGDFDDYIDSWADGLAAFRRPVFLNFAHEMNGNWYPWGIGVNGNKPGEFIDAWRHVHDRFSAAKAVNVVWVWTPNEMYEDVPATVEEVYPGDDYVNWFGMNGFNWGKNIRWESCDCQSSWRTFHEIFDTTYHRLVALADKPIMIGEVGSSEIGGNKAAWITEAFLEQLPLNYPRIRAVSWFNKVATGLDMVEPGVVEPTNAEVDWRVTSSPAAQEAFATAVGTPYFQGSLI